MKIIRDNKRITDYIRFEMRSEVFDCYKYYYFVRKSGKTE